MEGCLDVAASGVWGGRFERALLDIRVFNPHARSNRQQSITATYRKHEAEKRRAYEERVRKVEHASFSPSREVLLYVLGTRRKESRELSSRSRNVKKCCSALRFT